MDIVSTVIRTEIDLYDEALKHQQERAENFVDGSNPTDESETDSQAGEDLGSPRVIHGSLRPLCSLSQLEIEHSNDLAFRNVRIKLSGALAKQLNVSRVTLRASDTVSPVLIIF